jgi:hypothetical protein
MAGDIQEGSVGQGQITSGLPKGGLVERTLTFVRCQLPRWRDDRERPHEEAEEKLNAQLCKFLSAKASHEFPMVQFHHEEKQTERRRVDMSAGPTEGTFVGSAYHSIYEPFLVFEGKRLPAPSNDREREYVTGGSLKTGGIQRFRLGLHGPKLQDAAIVGYLQQGNAQEWFRCINSWIVDLAASTGTEEEWTRDDALGGLKVDKIERIAHCVSTHNRTGPATSPRIRLVHLWVEMS